VDEEEDAGGDDNGEADADARGRQCLVLADSEHATGSELK